MLLGERYSYRAVQLFAWIHEVLLGGLVGARRHDSLATMDGIVFDRALTKPDLLVLQNLAADIDEHSLADRGIQSNELPRLNTNGHKAGERDLRNKDSGTQMDR